MNRVWFYDRYCLEYDLSCQKRPSVGQICGAKWVGLLDLASKEVADMVKYRKAVEDQLLGQTKFTLCPKGALEW